MNSIQFFKEDTRFRLDKQTPLKKWILQVVRQHKKTDGDLSFIFCSDRYLLKLNKQYLNHGTYTDIITFNISDRSEIISGDIFVSIDRVRENAEIFSSRLSDELHRVIIHGVLHLIGYKDKTKKEKAIMREKENEALALRKF